MADETLDEAALNASLSSIVTGLLDPEEAMASVAALAHMVDHAEGDTANAVGKAIRDFGAMSPLLDLLDQPGGGQEYALRVIGNLASNAVDSHAEETKRLLHDLGAFPRVLPLIYSQSNATIVYALGAVQNLLVRPEYALHMRDTRADVRLRALLASTTDETTKHFANGCLSNMKAVLEPNYAAPDLKRMSPQQALAVTAAGLDAMSISGAARATGGSSSGLGDAGGHRGARAGEARALARLSVPADNNCLFTTCALLCDPACRGLSPEHDFEKLLDSARNLRRSCAKLVADSPDSATTLALLDFDNADAYGRWIMDDTHWGGEPEVSMIAEYFDVEITVASCDGSGILHYGGGRKRKVVYLLYTGQHYDPLVGPPPRHMRTFPPADTEAAASAVREAAAMQLAEEHSAAAALAAVERSLPIGSLPASPAPHVAMGKPVKF